MIARLLLCVLAVSALRAADPVVEDRVQFSLVLTETRNFRIILPPDYATSTKRYPVLYWFHGEGERFNSPDAGMDSLANFVATHDLIVVKPDGFNPRFSGDNYDRPYNVGPVETGRQFPLYFPELVGFIDANFRTIPDRDHRATSGFSMGGFMAYWIAGKFPHLIGSASSFMGSPEFLVGPRDFPVEYRHDEMFGNYEGVHTRLVSGTHDPAQFYQHQLNGIWHYTRAWHEIEEVDAGHAVADLAKTLEFHMNSFAHPLPKPSVWNHADVYPNFGVWDWEVTSDRKQPGFTVLENVSASGFRSCVREWLPSGATIPNVKISIATGRLYPPHKPQTVTIVPLDGGKPRRQAIPADAEGRLHIDLDGGAYEVGIATGAVLALSGYELEDAAWATAGAPVKIRVRIWNKGAAPASASNLRWLSPNPGVDVSPMSTPLPAIAPGNSTEVSLTLTPRDPARTIVEIVAVQGDTKMPVTIPLLPPAQPFTEYSIADGQAFRIFQHATEKAQINMGDGNGDGKANPGERFAILLPENDAYRAAEVFTNDACIDNTLRAFDDWSTYDHVGASAKYSLPMIKSDCQPGHVIHLLARVMLPGKPANVMRVATIDLPVAAFAKAPL